MKEGPSLSPREAQILQLAMDSLTDSGISNKLGISIATVGTYWGRIRIKYGPVSRPELVAIFLRAEAQTILVQLQDSQEKLKAKIQSLEIEKAKLQDAVKQVESIIDGIPEAVLVVDETGIIRCVNRAAGDTFGRPDKSLTGLPIAVLIPERVAEQHHIHRAEYFKHPSHRRMGQHFATVAVRANGEEFPIAATLA